jgi:hypothetical protein
LKPRQPRSLDGIESLGIDELSAGAVEGFNGTVRVITK